MKICIIHDSQRGNGLKVAEKMREAFVSLGAKVMVGHWSETTPESVVEYSPDLLVLGAAIRKFMTGPASKRWMSSLASAVKERGMVIAAGAIFITHIMPKSMADERAQRFSGTIMSYAAIGQLYPDWFSGPVRRLTGPLVENVLDNADQHARALFEWATAIVAGK